MYNYQAYLKENQLKKKFEDLKKQYKTQAIKKQKIIPTLINGQRKRVEGFILSMIEKPIEVSVYKDKKYEPRTLEKTKHLSKDSFSLNHHTQKQRLTSQISKNKCLDNVPFNNTFSHKFRDDNSQNHRPMKYKPYNASFRIRQKFDKQALNYLKSNSNKRLDKSVNRFLHKENIQNLQEFSKTIYKAMFPNLHQKTYFKSVNTLFSQSPNCFIQNNKQFEKDIATFNDETHDEENEFQNRKETKKVNDHVNRKQNSREALIKCGLLNCDRMEKRHTQHHSQTLQNFRA